MWASRPTIVVFLFGREKERGTRAERRAFHSFFLEVIQEIVYKNGYKRAIRESPLRRGCFFEEKHFLAEKEGEY